MWVFVYLHIRGDSNVGFLYLHIRGDSNVVFLYLHIRGDSNLCIYILGVIVMWVFVYLY